MAGRQLNDTEQTQVRNIIGRTSMKALMIFLTKFSGDIAECCEVEGPLQDYWLSVRDAFGTIEREKL